MANVPLATHVFLLAVPAAFVAGALLIFLLRRRRDS